MSKRRREEETIETGNVDDGDFSEGDCEGSEGDESEDKYSKYAMREEDIEGQEDPTQEFDGEIQLTAFNMKEELEEGHVDKDGHYIPKREKDEVKDHWLDNIDWVKVNSQTAASKSLKESEDNMDVTESLTIFNPIPIYKEILSMLSPQETVLKALKRLGGGKIQTASERWKKKKQSGQSSQSSDSNKELISKLTELADSILSNAGNMDIYQETYEGIQYKIKQSEASKSEADMDMFGDVYDEKIKKEANFERKESEEDEPLLKKVRFNEDENNSSKGDDAVQNSVSWEFKWKNEDTEEIHGPHSTSEMLNWVSEGYFEAGVWVRRVGQPGDFYSSRRVDFDLYL